MFPLASIVCSGSVEGRSFHAIFQINWINHYSFRAGSGHCGQLASLSCEMAQLKIATVHLTERQIVFSSIQVLICCHNRLPMPRRDSEEEDDAPPPPCFTTPTKTISNDGASHADPVAEGTESESNTDDEKEFDKSTGKMRN